MSDRKGHAILDKKQPVYFLSSGIHHEKKTLVSFREYGAHFPQWHVLTTVGLLSKAAIQRKKRNRLERNAK